jgi:hypothetical protein
MHVAGLFACLSPVHRFTQRDVHRMRDVLVEFVMSAIAKSKQGSRPLPAPLFASTNEAYFFFAAFFAGFFAFFAAFFLAAIVLAPFKEGLSLAIPR